MRRLPRHPFAAALAGLLALLVLALSLLTVSPEAHAWLHASGQAADHDHAHEATSDDTGCAVVLYAHGVTPPITVSLLPLPAEGVVVALISCPATPVLMSASRLRPPGRAPPACG